MLETVNLDLAVTRERYEEVFPQLGLRLAELQRELRSEGVPVVVVFEGWDAAGKGTSINRLMQPLDPRGFKVHGIKAPNEEEVYRPFLWRFWTKLPSKGFIAIFDRSWYGRVLAERVDELVPSRRWKAAYEEIRTFERQLTDSGVVLVKLFLHISRKEQRRRFKRIERDTSEAWKVNEEDWRHHAQYDEYFQAVEDMLARTSTAAAPWTIVEAHDRRHTRIKIFRTLIAAMEQELGLRHQRKLEQKALAAAGIAAAPSPPPPAPAVETSVLKTVDLQKKLSLEEYTRELETLQERFRELEHEIYVERVPVVIIYEGWDAAGKGGNIKRLTNNLDPRGYEVISIAAPTDEEKAHHYLWRFWRYVPKAGHITIFDRSWYGRVLVERVEGFCSPTEWQRGYHEINEFESHLADNDTVIVKLWLHVSQEEQLRRFQERQALPHKNWKLTDEDWRNRDKWPRYEQAVSDMIERTSTSYAPWAIVESEDKLYARIKVLRTAIRAIEGMLKKHRR